jgi:hypothetical protein
VTVDEGLPIAYPVLEQGVPVYSSDREEVGQVDHVVAAPAEDIFHGIVMRTASEQKFIAADQIESLHEHGVDLRIAATEVADLPAPHGAAPARHVREPGIKPSRWKEILDVISGASPRRREWKDEE